MEPVQYLITVMLSAHLIFALPLTEMQQSYTEDGRECKLCPAGTIQKSCTECEPCSEGHYMAEPNRQKSCKRCYSDCRPDRHQKVVQECTRTTNLKCLCVEGYRCENLVPLTDNCRYCVRIQDAATTESKAVQTPSSSSAASSGRGSPSAGPCQPPHCGVQPIPTSRNDSRPGVAHADEVRLAAILCPMLAMACVALVILLCICPPGDETCFKRVVAKLQNKGARDASIKSKESTHQIHRHSCSTKQAPPSAAAANLGPVHVHNAGTVIFGILSHFTGQVGGTAEVKRSSGGEEDDKNCPAFPPASPSSVPLSEEEEERSRDTESIYFPSQEEGKDCHLSKEEEL